MVAKCCRGYATLCRVFTYLWLIAAVVLSCFALASCEFVTRAELTMGLFRFSRSGSECMEYSDENNFDYGWLHKWAAVSSVLAPLFGFLVIILMLVDCCCNVCCSKYMQTFFIVCCQFNQGCSFLIWLSDACFTRKGDGGAGSGLLNRGCRIGDGSIYAFVATMLYLVAGFSLCCNPKPDQLCCKKDDDEDEKNCCGKGKDKKPSDEKGTDEKPAAKDEGNPIAAAAVKEEEIVQEEKAETKAAEETKDEEQPETAAEPADESVPEETGALAKEDVADAQATPDEEAPEEKDAPAVVPVPVPVPASPREVTPPPEEDGMEIEFDEEFGTSQIRA